MGIQRYSIPSAQIDCGVVRSSQFYRACAVPDFANNCTHTSSWRAHGGRTSTSLGGIGINSVVPERRVMLARTPGFNHPPSSRLRQTGLNRSAYFPASCRDVLIACEDVVGLALWRHRSRWHGASLQKSLVGTASMREEARNGESKPDRLCPASLARVAILFGGNPAR